MGGFLYYLLTFLEAGLGIFGLRLYEQPPYRVTQCLPGGVELRLYQPRLAAETAESGDDGAAFERLFHYITGANAAGARIAMTAPVSQEGARIAMTAPVASGDGIMRFYLPAALAATGAPAPTDPLVHVRNVPAEPIAALRFSGTAGPAAVAAEDKLLLAALAQSGQHAQGAPFLLTYDAPFTLPFFRRNEVAVRVAAPS